ncbi:MAG: glycosyltransferase [Candidatus Lokiarchaeota archaeon]|nr:glycosyltransferase [Candidatus Lokiarchaeota archaeon]
MNSLLTNFHRRMSMSNKKVNPLKLYIVSVQYPPHIFDIEGKIVNELASYLKRNGEEVNFCTLGIGDEIEEEKIYDPILGKKKDKNPLILLRFFAKDSKLIKNPYEGTKAEELRRFSSISNPIAQFVGIQQGIIHLHGNNAIPFISKIIKEDLYLVDETGSRKKIISTFYDLESYYLKTDPNVNTKILKEIQEMESLSFKFSDKIVVNRIFIKNLLKEIMKKDFEDEKIFLIPIPVNQDFIENDYNNSNSLLEYREKLAIWKDSKLISMFISSDQEFGLELLLNNIEKILFKMKNKFSIIISIDNFKDQDLFNKISRTIGDLNKQDNIQILILDLKDKEEKIKVLDDSEFYIAPSNKEKYDINILEAWARKKAVIAFNTQSNLELFGIDEITDQLNETDLGILIDINDNSVDLLEKSINILLNDSQKSKLMGENGKKRVTNNYTWDKFISKYYEIYKN